MGVACRKIDRKNKHESSDCLYLQEDEQPQGGSAPPLLHKLCIAGIFPASFRAHADVAGKPQGPDNDQEKCSTAPPAVSAGENNSENSAKPDTPSPDRVDPAA